MRNTAARLSGGRQCYEQELSGTKRFGLVEWLDTIASVVFRFVEAQVRPMQQRCGFRNRKTVRDGEPDAKSYVRGHPTCLECFVRDQSANFVGPGKRGNQITVRPYKQKPFASIPADPVVSSNPRREGVRGSSTRQSLADLAARSDHRRWRRCASPRGR